MGGVCVSLCACALVCALLGLGGSGSVIGWFILALVGNLGFGVFCVVGGLIWVGLDWIGLDWLRLCCQSG